MVRRAVARSAGIRVRFRGRLCESYHIEKMYKMQFLETESATTLSASSVSEATQSIKILLVPRNASEFSHGLGALLSRAGSWLGRPTAALDPKRSFQRLRWRASATIAAGYLRDTHHRFASSDAIFVPALTLSRPSRSFVRYGRHSSPILPAIEARSSRSICTRSCAILRMSPGLRSSNLTDPV